ncbi:MAG: hypothetical protein AB8G18_18495 [Gammaproteobacteria bacterium]
MRSNLLLPLPVLVGLSSIVMLMGCNESVSLQVLPAHKDDQVSWIVDPSPAFQVHCDTGIGSALIRPVEHKWPDRFQVVLELAALEGFSVRSGKEIHRLEVTRDGLVLLEPSDSKVLHMSAFQAIGKGSRFRIQVNPANFADATDQLRVEWVDYYR